MSEADTGSVRNVSVTYMINQKTRSGCDLPFVGWESEMTLSITAHMARHVCSAAQAEMCEDICTGHDARVLLGSFFPA